MTQFDNEDFGGAIVELTAPDGTAYRFGYAAIIPYAEKDYVVLMELETDEAGEEQILITRLERTPEGELSFVVVEEEDIISAVFEKYVAQSLAEVMDECDCEDCGHEHHHHDGGCDCGHDHHKH